MKRRLRTVGSWFPRALLFLAIAVVVDVGVLVFPSTLVAHDARFGEYRLYSDEPIAAGLEQGIDGDTDHPLSPMPVLS